MKIAVVGVGAMGSLFGGKLSSVADMWLWPSPYRAADRPAAQPVENAACRL